MKARGQGFPGGPVVKTPSFHCRGCGFDPGSGKFHVSRGAARKKRKTRVRSIRVCQSNFTLQRNPGVVSACPRVIHWQLGSEGVYTPSPICWGAASGIFLCTSSLPCAQEELSLKQVPGQRDDTLAPRHRPAALKD